MTEKLKSDEAEVRARIFFSQHKWIESELALEGDKYLCKVCMDMKRPMDHGWRFRSHLRSHLALELAEAGLIYQDEHVSKLDKLLAL